MKRLFCLLAFSLIIISCQLNPFIGVGNTVDTVAPVLNIASHENFQYVSGNLLCIYGTCSDNQRVTSINLKAEQNGELLFTWEIKNPVSPWSYSILLDPSANIKEQLKNNVAAADFRLPDGEYKFTLFAYDVNGNSSTTSYDSRTLVVDNEPSVSEITYPPLKTSLDFYVGESSRGESVGADSYDFDNSEYFCNGDFYIQGNVDDNYGVAGVSLTLTECNKDGEETDKKLTVSFDSSMEFKVTGNIEKHLLDVDTSKKVMSLWNWKVWFRESAKSEEDIKTPHYYKVNIAVKDSAGNTENDEKGYFCVLPKSDYPYTVFPGYGEKIPVGTPLSGTCYDDDGIKSIKLSLCNTAGETISGKEDFYDESIISNGNIFTWKMDKTIPAHGGSYLLKAEVIDINDKTSSYIVNADNEYLHSDKYREKLLNIVDLTAPAVDINAKKGKEETAENVDFDVYYDVVDSAGDFQVAVKVTDASQVRKVYMARVLNKASEDDVAKLSSVNPKTGNIDEWNLSANIAGIKFYKLYEYKAGDKATAEVQVSQVFNVFNDFEDEYATKCFYVYAENASGKTTVSSKLLLREEDKPEITILSLVQGQTLTIPFNISVSAEDFTGITDFTISCFQSGELGEKKLTLTELENVLKKTENRIDISKLSSEMFGSDSDFNSGACTLTFTAKDKYGNSTIEKLQFYIEKDDPFIKNVVATKNAATYKTGDKIEIRLEINKEVNVTGNPELTVSLSEGKTATAVYSRTEGNYLVFEYTVAAGDDCELLNCTALDLKGATIADSQNLQLREDSFLSEGSGSLMTNATIRIDTQLPKISAVKTVNPNGSYTVGQVIEIQVIFSENIEIKVPEGKKLRMVLNANTAETRYAEYSPEIAGSGNNKLMFAYTIAEGDNVSELAWTGWDVGPEVEITDLAKDGDEGKGNEFDFENCIAGENKWSNKLVIDTTPASIEGVESNYMDVGFGIGGSYDEKTDIYYCNAGKSINLTVEFSEPVRVSGTVVLTLNSGSVATYSSGSGSNKLNFVYTVDGSNGDDTDRNYLKVTGVSGKIIDYAKNELKAFVADKGIIKNRNIIIDTTAPQAPTLSVPKADAGTDTYTGIQGGKTTGVNVEGSFTDDDVCAYAWTENGNTENFQLLEDDETKINGVFGEDENEGFYQEYLLSLKLRDKAGNISNDSAEIRFVVDTDKPELTKALSSAVIDKTLKTSTTGAYVAGEEINISLVFNKKVTANGINVKLNNGEIISLKNGEAGHIEGSNDYFVTGVYTVKSDDRLNECLKIVQVTAGSVEDCLNNKLDSDALNQALGADGFENIDALQEIKIDVEPPTIKEISSSKTDGWYTVGEVIMINVVFSEPVEFSGDNPKLKLTGGGEALYVSGNGTENWIFNYTVKAGQNTGDSSIDSGYLTVTSILGEITDLAGVTKTGNSLVTTIPVEGTFKDNKIGIDTIAPAALELNAVHSVKGAVTDGKAYSGEGGKAYVTVSIGDGQEENAKLYVTKNSEVICDWQSSFDGYQCKPDAGEVLDYTIVAVQRDLAGNVSPEVSIEFNIDDSVSMLESIGTSSPSGTCTVGTIIPITLTFNKEVIVSSPITVTLNAVRDRGSVPVKIGVTDTFSREITGMYDVQNGDVTKEVLNVLALSGTVKDKLEADFVLDNSLLETATNLAATKQITIDTTPPLLDSIVTPAANGWYKAGDVIVITLTFNEDVKVGGTKDMLVLKLSNGASAIYQSGNGQVMNFIYTVAAGNDTDEDNLRVTSLESGAIVDLAGNTWVVAMPDNNFAGNQIGIDTAINDITITDTDDKDCESKTYTDTHTFKIKGLTDLPSGVKSYVCTINGEEQSLVDGDKGEKLFTCVKEAGMNKKYVVNVRMTDNAGNVSSKSVTISIDGEEIDLQGITTTTDTGTYTVGEEIPITLTFNKDVKVTSDLTLTLTNGKKLTIRASNKYSNAFTVNYIVASGEDGEVLDVESVSGVVEDARPTSLQLDSINSDLANITTIADTHAINIDTKVPTITGFTTTATDGWYNAGKMIQITMECSEIVNVAGNATLSLSSGGKATYLSGTGSKNIVFVYMVADNDSTAGNKQLTVSQVNGTIRDIATNDLSKSLPEHCFACGVDTKAPGSMTIKGITNNKIVTSCESLEIDGFGENEGSGIASYTVNINGTETTVNETGSGTLTFADLSQSIRDNLTVVQGGKQLFAISVYQTDVAGNKSAVSDTLSFTVDTNKTRLLAVKSSKSNETCTTGGKIDISLEFSRRTSGDISIKLNACSTGTTLSDEGWSSDGYIYTVTYTVGSSDNATPLQITGISGTVIDDLGTQNMSALWSNTDDMNLSSYNVNIDTTAPSCLAPVANYNPTAGSATVTYTFNENVSIVAGKKITLTREAYAAPIVLTPAQYNEYYTLNSGIKTYYEKTINGADPSDIQKADLSAKYVLKYEYNPDNTALKNIFAGMGYYKQEIVMESSAVAVSGNVVTVTIPKENLMTGETYTVTADTGIVKDNVGLKSGSIATKTTFITGNKPQPPVIRVNKISGRGDTAKITTMKIHTVTQGAIVYYNSSNSSSTKYATPGTEYSESSSVTWRGKTYYGVIMGNDNSSSGKYWITAKATKGNTDSDISYERAFKTVIKTSQDVDNTTHFMVFRGGDVESGSNTISGFPVTWDEKSVSATWSLALADSDAVEKELAKYGMLLASNKKAITWGVPEKIYFHGLKCKKSDSKLLWMWQMENAVKVNAGEDGTDSNNFEAKYHDRDGGNY